MKSKNIFPLYAFLVLQTMSLSMPVVADSIASSGFFNLSDRNDKAILTLDEMISAPDTFDLRDIRTPISGFSVDMDIIASSEDYMVRLVMEDMNGNIYLVAESTPMTSDSKNTSFTDYSEETQLLWSVVPKCLRVYPFGATIKLKKLTYLPFTEKGTAESFTREKDRIGAEQAREKCAILKTKVQQEGKLWFPEVTSLSQMSFSDRMRILGFPETTATDGIEYYGGGIFDFRSHSWEGELTSEADTSLNRTLCIEEFSWRDRHGRDWLTPVKDQGQSGYCSAFTAVSCTEAIANLFYNQKIDMDLSEQEAAVCNGTSSPWVGMSLFYPLNYLKNHGVCEESAYPFVNSPNESTICRSDEISPEENVRIASYHEVTKNEQQIKKALIKYGPLASGFTRHDHNLPNNQQPPNHAMALYGYDVIQAGDTIFQLMEYGNMGDHGLTNAIIVGDSSEFIGRTVWKFKNSYINGGINCPPFMLITFDNISHMVNTYSIRTPITSQLYSAADIVCEDRDGDGFYFWGIGSKPNSCPSWVPDEPDGNDDDSHVGPMDEYGYTDDANPEDSTIIYINANTTTSTPTSCRNNVVVQNSAKWTISSELHFHYGSWVRVKSGATLLIDAGALVSARVFLESGSTLIIKNNGLLVTPSTARFFADEGVNVRVINGKIL